jgi:hypothetical protein
MYNHNTTPMLSSGGALPQAGFAALAVGGQRNQGCANDLDLKEVESTSYYSPMQIHLKLARPFLPSQI